MSSFWAANHGIALLLSYEEMEKILEIYCKKYPDSESAEKRRMTIFAWMKKTSLPFPKGKHSFL